MPVSAHGERGLVTLEWLLIVGAIAGLAAVSVLTVQRVLDTATDLPADPDTLIVDAEITAAKLADEATEPGADEDDLEDRCEAIADHYSDVIDSATWNTASKRCELGRKPEA